MAAGVLDAYAGLVFALIGLAAVLTVRVLAEGNEPRSWWLGERKRSRPGSNGPISEMTREVIEAASGDMYSRAELSNLLGWLSRPGGYEEGLGPTEISTARRVLLAGSKTPVAKDDDDVESPLVSSKARGREFVAELEREVHAITDG